MDRASQGGGGVGLTGEACRVFFAHHNPCKELFGVCGVLFSKFLTMKKGTKGSGRRRTDIERPHNGGNWSKARFRSFITSALRSATVRWGPRWACIDRAFVRTGPNPKTGRMCKLHRCAICGELFPKGQLIADHVDPVVCPDQGFINWDTYISRMFCEVGGFQALCKPCSHEKTQEENARRRNSLKTVMAPRKRNRVQHD